LHILARKDRVEEDLVDQLFNQCIPQPPWPPT
jgi:hypothetical protein